MDSEISPDAGRRAKQRGPLMDTYPEAPDLDALVATFGSYSEISPEAWAAWDEAIEAWQLARRDYTLGDQNA
jgi:hypothetical protein